MIGVYFRHEEAIYFLYSFLSSAYAEVDQQKLHLICHTPLLTEKKVVNYNPED